MPIIEELKEEKDVNEASQEENSGADLNILREMIGAGLIYGHNKSKTNPAFKKYIHTNRNGIDLIDLNKTLLAIDEVSGFLKQQVKENKLILLVATQPVAKEAVERMVKELGVSFIKRRWIGGLLTNFENISKRIEYFKKTKEGLVKGEFAKYTKKERLNIEKDLEKMEGLFGGLESLTRLPDILFIVDTSFSGHDLAMAEARKCGIPTVAVIDNDDNPELVDYSVPANDHTRSSINWVIDRMLSKVK